jgi:hypothetical protein
MSLRRVTGTIVATIGSGAVKKKLVYLNVLCRAEGRQCTARATVRELELDEKTSSASAIVPGVCGVTRADGNLC